MQYSDNQDIEKKLSIVGDVFTSMLNSNRFENGLLYGLKDNIKFYDSRWEIIETKIIRKPGKSKVELANNHWKISINLEAI